MISGAKAVVGRAAVQVLRSLAGGSLCFCVFGFFIGVLPNDYSLRLYRGSCRVLLALCLHVDGPYINWIILVIGWGSLIFDVDLLLYTAQVEGVHPLQRLCGIV